MSPSIPGPSTISPTLYGSPMISSTAMAEEVWKWMEQNERAHGNKLTFDAVETQITLEEAHLNPSGPLDSTFKASNKFSAHLPNSAAWSGLGMDGPEMAGLRIDNPGIKGLRTSTLGFVGNGISNMGYFDLGISTIGFVGTGISAIGSVVSDMYPQHWDIYPWAF
ncbi:hypothetical protein PAXRUDRAFT_22395 [Paxillus rubicundulus Ve08.2h10]|uniref:Unplaced genomic scaffold scaffold_6410, whole genome shotgun sequence n=1 Tax=Paxillus rubicundulus Ve08.2h10 TaxID=930991 RepID=A0A0D0CXJ6_9AGAM|nr:hypothetical protein PAXRUDRAFT_22395 [Paxillus rubicundulus Ve08.2h10]